MNWFKKEIPELESIGTITSLLKDECYLCAQRVSFKYENPELLNNLSIVYLGMVPKFRIKINGTFIKKLVDGKSTNLLVCDKCQSIYKNNLKSEIEARRR